jgi:hypothetical protein
MIERLREVEAFLAVGYPVEFLPVDVPTKRQG